MDYELSISDYVRLLRRRLPVFLVVAFIVGLAGSLLVFSLPSKYSAFGTILVESQQIPDQLVQSTITAAAQERIRVIQQRVMTRANLIQIIDKYGLFSDEGNRMSITEMVDEMRKNIDLEITDISRQGRRTKDETAVVFTVTYQDKVPRRALRVANEFVTLFLEENVRARTTRASETTQFLTGETNRLGADLARLEQQIADYKSKQSTALPEHLNLHFSMLERAKGDLDRVESNIQQAQEDIRLYELELTALKSGGGETGNSESFTPARELVQLQNQLSQLRLSYLDSHPEIRSILDRIEVLEAQVDTSTARKDMAKKLAEAEILRDAAVNDEGLFSDKVKQLDARITDLKKQIEDAGSGDPIAQAGTAFELKEARLGYRSTALEQRVTKWSEDKARLITEIKDLEQRILRTPQVESDLQSLQRSYETALAQYTDITRKQQGAELAENLEEDQKAERFVLLEPPVLPEKPASPNRTKLMMVVLIVAGGLGAVVAFAKDLLTGTLYSPRQLEQHLGGLRVISVPQIQTVSERRQRKKQLIWVLASMPVVFLFLLVGVHFFYTPVDVLFYKVLTRF